MFYDGQSAVPGATVLPPFHSPPSAVVHSGQRRAQLPPEEFKFYLEQKLRELERTDSALSGKYEPRRRHNLSIF